MDTNTKTFAPHGKFYKMLPPQDWMWAQRWSKQILPTLAPTPITWIIPEVTPPPSQGVLNKPIQGGGGGGVHNTNLLQLYATALH